MAIISKKKDILHTIGFIIGVIAGILCLVLSFNSCNNLNHEEDLLKQIAYILIAIYYGLLSLISFKAASWINKRSNIKEVE
jgi:CDP-diglyceride synthetase